MYFVGIFVFYKARREDGRKLFENKFEVFLCAVIIIVAAVSGYMWYMGTLEL